MDRWTDVDEQTIFDMTVKMYRDPYVPADTFSAVFERAELDYYAFKYLNTELLMYQIMNTNFESYIEERGDLDRVTEIEIPIREDETETIY